MTNKIYTRSDKIQKILNKNFVLGIFAGGFIFSGVVFAASSYLAKDISFTPKNKDWKATNVEEAINDLYDKSNSYSNCISDYGEHEANSQIEIDIGFTPTYFMISEKNSGNNGFVYYDKKISDNIIGIFSSDNSSSTKYTYTNYNNYVKIADKIVTNIPSNTLIYKQKYTYHYIICKE